MTDHPAFAAGSVAAITGAASGIGLATANFCARHGMHLALADIDTGALDRAAATLRAAFPDLRIEAVVTDVSKRSDVERLRDVATGLGRIGLVMNNAGTEGRGGGIFGDPARWQQILDVNLWGVINGVQVFAPVLMAQAKADGKPALIVNTGSKQGITMPPGDTAYNVSKAGIKAVTEALAHELREAESLVTAHLLIPGFTYTGFTRAAGATEKPDAAWTPEQVVDFMAESLARGDFYILCPDNAVDRRTDERRMEWAMGDIIENRPALSRWDKRYKDAFAQFLAAKD